MNKFKTDLEQKLNGYRLVTVDLFYYNPDYNSLIQEFVWQTYDTIPNLERVHRFLNYWKENIDAVIKEIFVSYEDTLSPSRYVSVNHFLKLH